MGRLSQGSTRLSGVLRFWGEFRALGLSSLGCEIYGWGV